MKRWHNCVAVVTGASSGIGEAIAKDLVKAELRVVALDLRVERLNQNREKLCDVEKSRFYAKKCDVTNELEVNAAFDWIDKTLGGTDILVNSAGVLHFGNLLEMHTSLIDVALNTNVKGLIYCTQAAFKSMKNRNFAGHLVHINSVAGHHVIPLENISRNIYSPSKFAVTAINETLRNELKNLGTKIKTTSVSPGAVRTEIAPKEVFDALGEVLNAEDIAQVVLFAISTPPHVQIHEITVKPVGQTVYNSSRTWFCHKTNSRNSLLDKI